MTSSKLAAGMAAVMTALVGCTLTQTGLRKEDDGPIQIGNGAIEGVEASSSPSGASCA